MALFQQSRHWSPPSSTIDVEGFENAGADESEERNDTERTILLLDEHDSRAWKAVTIAGA